MSIHASISTPGAFEDHAVPQLVPLSGQRTSLLARSSSRLSGVVVVATQKAAMNAGAPTASAAPMHGTATGATIAAAALYTDIRAAVPASRSPAPRTVRHSG